MTLLALVRHGQTNWNAQRRIQGRTNLPLNAQGRAQARAAARNLSATQWDRVVSSQLLRAKETADIVTSALRLEAAVTHSGLAERDYGVAEGMPVEVFHDLYGDFAEIPLAETNGEVAERTLSALRELITPEDDKSAIVVTHGGVIRALLWSMCSTSSSDALGPIANGSVTFVRFTYNGLTPELRGS